MNFESTSAAVTCAELVKKLPRGTIAKVIAALEKRDTRIADVLPLINNHTAQQLIKEVLTRSDSLSFGFQSFAWMLRGALAVQDSYQNQQSCELVWTGPEDTTSSFYRTEQTLLELIEAAQHSLLVVTYVAYRVEQVREALKRAVHRGVRVNLVVEVPVDSGGKLSLDPLAALMLDDPLENAELGVWYWPAEERSKTETGKIGSLHAKCATADDELLFISSANLTTYALEHNIELGVILRGGEHPAKVRELFEGLMRRGVLHKK